MKTFFFVLGQLVLFGLFTAIFFVGSFLGLLHRDPFPMHWFLTHPTPTTVRYFVPTGLILMSGLYCLIFLMEAAARKVRTAGLWTTVVYLLALVVGLVEKFGFATHDLR